MKSRCFKLYRAYSLSFNSSKLGNFFWSRILKDCIEVQKKKKKVVALPVHVLHKTWNKAFSRHSHAVTGECTKKRDARTELLLFQSKLIAFLPFSLTSQSSLLKLLMTSCEDPIAVLVSFYIILFLPSKLPSFVYFWLRSSMKSACQLRDPLANKTKPEARIGG